MILMNDFKAESVLIKEAEISAVNAVLESGNYILGPQVESFEKNWSDICGTNFGIGVGNGMDAIEIILRASNVGSGDEVITTSMTAFATILAILRAGAIPVLADINPASGLLDIESVQRRISKKTKAVILVHLYGQISDMREWTIFAENNQLVLIEDCAQSHLAKYDGQVAGSFGAAGAYSFYPTKNLGCIGDGGMIVTNSKDIFESAKMLRNYGQSVRYEHPIIGLNSRLDEIQAAILNVRLVYLEEFTNKRRSIASSYNSGISNKNIEMLDQPKKIESHVYHLFVIKCNKRAELQQHLIENDIQSLIHYPIPIHKQKSIHSIRIDSMGLKNAEIFSESCLSLPCHPQLKSDEVDVIINVINAFKG